MGRQVDTALEASMLPGPAAMHIWIVNHYADPPEGQATRTYDISHHLVAQGHQVTIFACDFSHYRFARRHDIGFFSHWTTETVGGVRFVWIKAMSYRRNDWRRVVNMVSFAIKAVLRGSLDRDRPDVVIGVSVHPLGALAGYFLSLAKRTRYSCEITDLWPQTLIDFGRLRQGSLVARTMRRLERFLYRRADKIFMLWRNTDAYVESLGVSSGKIVWLPHGVDLTRYAALEPYQGGVEDRFCIMFLGGFASGNAIDIILEAAGVVQRRAHKQIRFVLIGAGQEKASMIELAGSLGLKNVEFRDAMPKTQIARAMNEADAFIYGVRDLPLYRFGISHNKMTDYLAAGRPIIFFGRSAYDPVAESGAGLSVSPGNAEAVADAIERLSQMTPSDRAEMGRRGRSFLLDHHHIPKLAERLLSSLEAT